MAFITIAGENKIAACVGNQTTLNLTHFVIAYKSLISAEPSNRIESMPSSGEIKYTATVSRAAYVSANKVVCSLLLDSTVGDFDFNWVGLVTSDNVLFAVSYITNRTIKKRKTANNTDGNNYVRNFFIEFSGAAAVTSIDVPAQTWQLDFTEQFNEADANLTAHINNNTAHEQYVRKDEINAFIEAIINYQVPVGIKIPVSSTAGLDSSWCICDGRSYIDDNGITRNTPDLTDKFIIGSGGDFAVTTGVFYGSNDASIPLHGHDINDGGHAHGYQHVDDGNDEIDGLDANSLRYQKFVNATTDIAQTGITINQTGVSAVNKNVPRSYAQIWVMKIKKFKVPESIQI